MSAQRRSKKVLVTGAGGFIGSHLCEYLAGRGYQVKALVHYNSRNRWGWLDGSPAARHIEVSAGDVRDYDTVLAAVKGVSVVFHLAALIGIPYSYHAPESYVDTNIKGTLNVLRAGRESGVKRIVHTSTSEIYGTAHVVPISEEHCVSPQSPYAASKAAADFLALSFYCSFGLPVAVVRPFNTYGPRQSARAVIPTIITQILSGARELRLGNLKPTRDLTYVLDTVEGFARAGESRQALGEIINLGNNSEISIGELAEMIARLMGARIDIRHDTARRRPVNSEVERLRADNRKARALLGWQPRWGLQDGLKETVAWFKTASSMYKPEMYAI